MTRSVTFSERVRIIAITSTTTSTLLLDLIKTALSAKTGLAAELPADSVLQIIMTSNASLAVSDTIYGDELTLSANVRHIFPCENALQQLKLRNSATVYVEIYFG